MRFSLALMDVYPTTMRVGQHVNQKKPEFFDDMKGN